MTTCTSCDTGLPDRAKFCHECGSAVTAAKTAEYKQVTVLFADVVRSMDLAAALDPERLRDIMTAVFNRSSAVVQRYGGTVDKFTGDGIMALFGAPVALEDHAVRACLSALDIQRAIKRFAAEIEPRDGIHLQLRIGLNSGQVIAGEIDSGPGGYTVVGEQVGLAQRMESVAAPGGVMLSESTAGLVEQVLALDEPELVRVKGADRPQPARRLIATAAEQTRVARNDPTLVGRDWEISTLTTILERAVRGSGRVLEVSGPPGIGKSRITREAAEIAKSRGIEVFTTYCESHASGIPFHAVAPLLRNVFGVNELSAPAARARVRAILAGAHAEDLVLFDDLLGIRDTEVELPDINADARHRRLARLVKAASLARSTPALYIVEDAHWIDEVSDAMIAEFASVIPQARAMVLVTYRPEYRGALARTSNAHKLALAPLDPSESSVFTTELIGSDPSVADLAELITERAAGNPFFAQEIVRDLAERVVLDGERGAYVCPSDTREVRVPATVQATIAARVDRLDPASKSTLLAASVIGARFSDELLHDVLGGGEQEGAAVARLIDAELLEQAMFTPRAEYAFCHPLVRTVAYESQLRSDRANLHRRLAMSIEQRDPVAADENAALIAEHLEAAGDLHAAFGWHMRAGTWLVFRDIGAAKLSWQRARRVADRLPTDDPNRLTLRIAPRTLICANSWRIGGSVGDAGFDELRELTSEAGDKISLTIGMAGVLPALVFNNCTREAAQLATECTTLIESIGDPRLTVALMDAPVHAKAQAAEALETRRLAQRIIELADGDPTMGNLVIGSPLAMAMMLHGVADMYLGMPSFRDHIDQAGAIARAIDPATFASIVMYEYVTILCGVFLPDDTALHITEDALIITEHSADHFALASARLARGVVLVCRKGAEQSAGFHLLAQVREMALAHRFTLTGVDMVDIAIARAQLENGDVDGPIEICRVVLNNLFTAGDNLFPGAATTILVEALLRRGTPADVAEAAAATERLAAVPLDPGVIWNEIPVLRARALLARACGDEAGYREFADRYRARATEAGFEGHMALAAAMD